MILQQFDDESFTVYNYRLEFINKYSNDNNDVSEKELLLYPYLLFYMGDI
jgi:hypothetical protein